MPRELANLIPDPENVLRLHPEELAGLLLQILRARGRNLHRYNFINDLYQQEQIYPRAYVDRIGSAISEAWSWLEAEGLLAPDPRQSGDGWFFVTRKGAVIESRDGFEAYRKASLLPRDLLHPMVADKPWSNFMRGDYDTAVFQAFKEVEVAVRRAGGFDARIIGTDLMRAAFHPDTGPLSDTTLPKAERESLAHLFAGALGSYKNPSSHRTITISDPVEAGEMLILASHLLRIVDQRAAMGAS